MMTGGQSLVEAGGGEQVVRVSRPTDAIGAALRNAYDSPAGAPDDMLAMLRRLDQDERRPH